MAVPREKHGNGGLSEWKAERRPLGNCLGKGSFKLRFYGNYNTYLRKWIVSFRIFEKISGAVDCHEKLCARRKMLPGFPEPGSTQLVKKVFLTSCLRFSNFVKSLKNALIKRERKP